MGKLIYGFNVSVDGYIAADQEFWARSRERHRVTDAHRWVAFRSVQHNAHFLVRSELLVLQPVH